MKQLEVKNIWIRVQLEYKSIVNMGPYTVDCHLRLGRQQIIIWIFLECKKREKVNIPEKQKSVTKCSQTWQYQS
jgi:hypothetical protein